MEELFGKQILKPMILNWVLFTQRLPHLLYLYWLLSTYWRERVIVSFRKKKSELLSLVEVW